MNIKVIYSKLQVEMINKVFQWDKVSYLKEELEY